MTDKSASAFPVPGLQHDESFNGMNLRQYAAIKLRVPDSGADWLDDMIRKSQRNELAARAMQAFAGLSDGFTSHPDQYNPMSSDAYLWADAMITAQEAK